MESQQHNDLLVKALNIKKRFLAMYKAANAGHVGCALSCAEMLTFVRFGWMTEDDEIILSKGHAAAALYSLLAEEGILSDSEIATFYQNGTHLAAHPPAGKIKRIPFATGSLGHGLSIAAGLGLAAKFKRNCRQIFCITSDGEINEGSTWEAALFIRHHHLKNVVWLIDRNRLQGYGRTEDVMQLEPLADKLQAFGFHVIETDGHDFNSFELAKQSATESEKPSVLICNTIKGNNWLTYANKIDCHYLPMNAGEYEMVVNEVEAFYQTKLKHGAR